MARLPIQGGDEGQWGTVLNEFLEVEHNPDGTLKASGTLSTKADNDAVVHKTGDESVAGVKDFTSSPLVPTPTTNTQAANKQYVDAVASAGANDATTTTNGLVRLAGDLGGTGTTAAAPVISDNAITTAKLAGNSVTSDKIANGTITNDDISASAAIDQSKISGLSGALAGKVDTSRTINTGTGLTGGGDLAADRTLSVTNDSTTQKVRVSKGGTLTAARQEVNLIEGSNVTITTADNPGSNRVDVTIAATTGASLARAVLIYDGSAYPARPTGYAVVEFVGPVDPDALAQENDTWINTA